MGCGEVGEDVILCGCITIGTSVGFDRFILCDGWIGGCTDEHFIASSYDGAGSISYSKFFTL